MSNVQFNEQDGGYRRMSEPHKTESKQTRQLYIAIIIIASSVAVFLFLKTTYTPEPEQNFIPALAEPA